MIAKQIIYFEKTVILACDAKCQKAWGINGRPKNQLSEDPDDYELLADHELPDAPADPGTYEGGHAKPTTPAGRLNKWCCRECERSEMQPPGEDFELPTYQVRVKNIQEGQP